MYLTSMQVFPMAPSPTMTSLTGTGSLSMYNINYVINMTATIILLVILAERGYLQASVFHDYERVDGEDVILTIFKSACRNP